MQETRHRPQNLPVLRDCRSRAAVMAEGFQCHRKPWRFRRFGDSVLQADPIEWVKSSRLCLFVIVPGFGHHLQCCSMFCEMRSNIASAVWGNRRVCALVCFWIPIPEAGVWIHWSRIQTPASTFEFGISDSALMASFWGERSGLWWNGGFSTVRLERTMRGSQLSGYGRSPLFVSQTPASLSLCISTFPLLVFPSRSKLPCLMVDSLLGLRLSIADACFSFMCDREWSTSPGLRGASELPWRKITALWQKNVPILYRNSSQEGYGSGEFSDATRDALNFCLPLGLCWEFFTSARYSFLVQGMSERARAGGELHMGLLCQRSWYFEDGGGTSSSGLKLVRILHLVVVDLEFLGSLNLYARPCLRGISPDW